MKPKTGLEIFYAKPPAKAHWAKAVAQLNREYLVNHMSDLKTLRRVAVIKRKKKMKKLKSILLAVPLALLLAGCAIPPKTEVSGTLMGQKFRMSSPKDSELKDAEVTVEQTGTNTTTAKIKIGSLTAKMNPDVITSQGAANSAMMNAAATFMEKAATALGAAAGTAAKELK